MTQDNPLARMFAKNHEAIAERRANAEAPSIVTPKGLEGVVIQTHHSNAPRAVPAIKPHAHNFAFMQSIARKAEGVAKTQANVNEVARAPSEAGESPKPATTAPVNGIAQMMERMRLAKETAEREGQGSALEPNSATDFDSEYDEQVDDSEGEWFERQIIGEISDLHAFNIMQGVNITPDPSQTAACHGLAKELLGCLIGAAGTGKTTTTRLLIHTLMFGNAAEGIEAMANIGVDIKAYHDKSGTEPDEYEDDEWEVDQDLIPAIALVAFTGQATQVIRKNFPPMWHDNIMTIHSLLGYHPVEFDRGDGVQSMRFEPYYTKERKMPWKVIAIDEASMVNLDLWHQLRDAATDDCRFYFIGDLNQLTPPIGQGILGFALAKLPTYELTVVHRQKDEAANRIVDTAWRVLKGQEPEFDDPTTDPNWRVIGYRLPDRSQPAHEQVINIAKQLSGRRVSASVDPDRPLIYDPWRDRIMTPMNGFNPDDPASLMGQSPINEALAQIFADPNEPRIVINAKKSIKKLAVGYRIMATKNEPPDAINRVTNGLTGKITAIEPNDKWDGDIRLVGPEDQVAANRRHMLEEALGRTETQIAELPNSFEFSSSADRTEAEERQGGPASHYVHIQFDNGATRAYGLNAQVDQLQLAYASTTHKAQGAEMPTAIIVVHQASRKMLCRENLYTAVTRARERVILLYTDQGLKIALNTQKIYGATLKEKIRQYQRFLGETEDSGGFKFIDVRLYPNADQTTLV